MNLLENEYPMDEDDGCEGGAVDQIRIMSARAK
jgi:hypothetical protein